MNKASIQAFAAGITFSTAIITGYLFFLEPKETEHHVTVVEATALLEKKGYTIQDPTQIEKKKPVNQPEPKAEKPAKAINYSLTIKPGMTSQQIADTLVNEHIIRDADTLTNYLRRDKLHDHIQVGTFILSKEMSIEQIAKTITK
ncbi:endolytic transglycosylase MltG [Peribacillus sp. FSL H8-0477]|uniref:endolytic transglycosylase MltG n=1 Tax=Peribacillus sp. FSL H8-0477 TaxID=2921388 RepID=UPI0030F6DB06